MKEETIYNVNSELQLEDYDKEKIDNGRILVYIKKIFIGFCILLCIYLLYFFSTSFLLPVYKLGIASEYIDNKNIDFYFSRKNQVLEETKPVHVRFEWNWALKASYLKIIVYKIKKDSKSFKEEEAIMGRRKPTTSNYIYFMGPLATGNYSIEVHNEKERILAHKEFQVR